MAAKEATVYIVDVGSTMREKSNGRTQTNLDWALEYVWDRITATIQTGRKTAMVGVVGLRTDDTENIMAEQEDYHHIKVLKDIDQALMADVRHLRSELVVSRSREGDVISALVIAIQMIAEKCKKLQYARRIVLVTDARASMQADDLLPIKDKIKADNIELTILGVDFDDADYGFTEEQKPEMKQENEPILRALCEDCNGNFGTLAQAIEETQVPRLKSTRPVASYKGLLTLGNPGMFNDSLTIDVERYPKTMRATPPSATQFALRSGAADATQSSATVANEEAPEGVDANGEGLSVIRNARTYQVVDENAAGGKKDIERDELSKGYEYGRTAVHISESDQNVTTFETTEGLDILGFVDSRQYRRYFDMERACLILPQKHSEKASMALSSLIHALYELESYAIARLVVKENKEPKLLLLAPHIEPDLECLFDIELPFAEDVRKYKFPPLDRVLTVSGKELTSHRNLPSADLLSAMSDYVDTMDLSTSAQDDEGGEAEYAPIDETFNPLIHRINQVIKHRAVHPDAALPPPLEICTKYSQPPEALLSQATSALKSVILASDVKKVPPKARGKRWSKRETSKPLSDLDVAALLATDPKRASRRLDPKNAVAGFKQMLETSVGEDAVKDACKQLKFIILDWVRHSVGDAKYGQAVEGLRVMREEMVEMEMPGRYNEVVREVKGKVLGGELGGDRREFWYEVRMARLKPISKGESNGSDMSEEEAKKFMIPQ